MLSKGLSFAVAALFAAALTPAAAEPMTPGASAMQSNPATITRVQFYDPGYYGYSGYGYGYGEHYYGGGILRIPGAVIGDTVGVAEGVLGAPYAGYAVPYAGGGVEACARRFRSFNPATGTYTAYSGDQVVCPYLGG